MKEAMKDKAIGSVFMAATVGLGLAFHWFWADILSFAVLIGIILHPVKSRNFALISIILLAIVPFLLMRDNGDAAEKVAIYAYYSLVFTVMMAVHELRSSERRKDD